MNHCGQFAADVPSAALGSLHESWRQQPGTPSYGADMPADKLREHLTSLGTKRTETQHAEFMANHAKQERAMAAQGNNLK